MFLETSQVVDLSPSALNENQKNLEKPSLARSPYFTNVGTY